MSRKIVKAKRVALRLTETQYLTLRQLADATGTNTSGAVRNLLDGVQLKGASQKPLRGSQQHTTELVMAQ